MARLEQKEEGGATQGNEEDRMRIIQGSSRGNPSIKFWVLSTSVAHNVKDVYGGIPVRGNVHHSVADVRAASVAYTAILDLLAVTDARELS